MVFEVSKALDLLISRDQWNRGDSTVETRRYSRIGLVAAGSLQVPRSEGLMAIDPQTKAPLTVAADVPMTHSAATNTISNKFSQVR